MRKEVTERVKQCAYCRLANLVNHENQMTLRTMDNLAPFDIIYLDCWTPGDIPSPSGESKVVTMYDAMTGFVDGAFLRQVTAYTVAIQVFEQFFGTGAFIIMFF